MKSAASRTLLLAACLALPTGAKAYAERLDHREQTSLMVSPGYEHLILSGRDDDRTVSEPGAFAQLAFGIPADDEDGEGIFGLRVGTGTDEGMRLVVPYVAYRGFAGYDEWKTFFDIGAFGRILPVWAVGARLGAGVQYELSQHAGVFFAAGGSVGYGDGLQVGLDAGVGLQLRFGVPGGGP